MVYKFSDEIEKQLIVFEIYLQSEKYAPTTIRQTRNYAGVYLEWIKENDLITEEIQYDEFKNFIFQLKATRSSSRVRHVILAVRHYYDSLDIDINPASGMYLKRSKSNPTNQIVPYEELTNLYQNYPTLNDRGKRNKIIIGIFIYQAITSGEMNRLETIHVKLKEGKLYVPGHGNSNSRKLELHVSQLLDLQEYLNVIRVRMLANIKTDKPGRKVTEINPIIYDRLFFSEHGSHHIKNSLNHMFRSIKRSYPKITSAKVIRATVIAEWLKTMDIRIVQYMTGHKHISTTEQYNAQNLQELKDSLDKYHPLK